jgi:hypothetical protein
MSGHGHVTPNPNGMKARCGGPGLCHTCSAELAAAHPGVPPTLAADGITTEDYAAIVEARRLIDGVSARLTDRGSPLVFVVACVTAHERQDATRDSREILE